MVGRMSCVPWTDAKDGQARSRWPAVPGAKPWNSIAAKRSARRSEPCGAE